MYTKLFGLLRGDQLSDWFFKDFKNLLSLDIDKLKIIYDSVSTKNGFDINVDSLFKLAKKIEINKEVFAGIIKSAEYVYTRIDEKGITIKEFLHDLSIFTEHFSLDLSDDKKAELTKLLFERNQDYELKQNITLHKRSIIPSARGITTLCDIRAVFDENSKIISYVPMIIASISTLNIDNKKDYYNFQFSEKSLKDFIKFLNEASEKLNTVLDDMGKRGIIIYKEDEE